MARELSLVVNVEDAKTTQKADKIGITYREVNIKTIYLPVDKFGKDFESGDRLLLKVVEKENADKSLRLEIISVEKL